LLQALSINPIEAEDLIQESFLQAFLELKSLKQPTYFGTWLYRITLNLARMYWRSGTKYRVLVENLGLALATSGWPDHQSDRFDKIIENRELRRQLITAIGRLPPAEQEAIRCVYMEGLSHRETAEATDASISAIKVRVYRGRERLRALLQEEYGRKMQITPQEKMNMIEVIIHDAQAMFNERQMPLNEALEQYEQLELQKDQTILGAHRIILLKEKDGDRVLPIWIGSFEGADIVLQVKNMTFKRPRTFDLMRSLLEMSGIRATQFAISRLHENIFYGTLTINNNGQTTEVDCRPSDGISLALRLDTPLFVDALVMQEAGLHPDEKGRYDFVGDCPPDSPLAASADLWRSLF
jgi:RNA polymerase sigma factor (sigma-70 family)